MQVKINEGTQLISPNSVKTKKTERVRLVNESVQKEFETNINTFPIPGLFASGFDIAGTNALDNIQTLIDKISGDTSTGNLADSLVKLGESLSKDSKPADGTKRKKIFLLYQLLKAARKAEVNDFDALVGNKFERTKRYHADDVKMGTLEEKAANGSDGFKNPTAWTSYLKDYLIWCDSHSDVDGTFILDKTANGKAKFNLDYSNLDTAPTVFKKGAAVRTVTDVNAPSAPKLSIKKPGNSVEKYLPEIAGLPEFSLESPFNTFIKVIIEQLGQLDAQLDGDFQSASCSEALHGQDEDSTAKTLKVCLLKQLEEISPSVNQVIKEAKRKHRQDITSKEAELIVEKHYYKSADIFQKPKNVTASGRNWQTGLVDSYGKKLPVKLGVNVGVKGDRFIDQIVHATSDWATWQNCFPGLTDGKHPNNYSDDAKKQRIKGEYYPQFFETPANQISSASAVDIKLVGYLLNAKSGYAIFDMPEEYRISKGEATKLLDAFAKNQGSKNSKGQGKSLRTIYLRDHIGHVFTDFKFHEDVFNESVYDMETRILKGIRAYDQFCDHTGLCCPTCTTDDSGSDCGADTCTKPKEIELPKPNIEGIKTSSLTDAKTPYMGSKTDIIAAARQDFESIDKVINTAFSVDGGADLPTKSFFDELELESERRPEGYVYAKLIDFSSNLLKMIRLYEVDKEIPGLDDRLVHILKNLVVKLEAIDPKTGDSNNVHRFFLAEKANQANELLGSKTDLNKVLYEATELFSSEDSNDMDFFRNYRAKSDSAEPKTKYVDVTVPFLDQYKNLTRPIEVKLIAGALGVGKSTILSNLIKTNSDGKKYIEKGAARQLIATLDNDAAGTLDADEAANKKQEEFKSLVVMSKEGMANFKTFAAKYGITVTDADKGKKANSADGVSSAVQGCICCNDRDIAMQMLADWNNTGNETIDNIIIEPTGMADGEGILNMALNPMGRLFYKHYYMAIDPSDPDWGLINKMKELAEHAGVDYATLGDVIDEIDDSKKTDRHDLKQQLLGLVGCSKDRQLGKKLLNWLKVVWAPMILSTHILKNVHAGHDAVIDDSQINALHTFANKYAGGVGKPSLISKDFKAEGEGFKWPVDGPSVALPDEYEIFDPTGGEAAQSGVQANVVELTKAGKKLESTDDLLDFWYKFYVAREKGKLNTAQWKAIDDTFRRQKGNIGDLKIHWRSHVVTFEHKTYTFEYDMNQRSADGYKGTLKENGKVVALGDDVLVQLKGLFN